MSLGIGLLTDDQLVELLQEACAELAQRDPIVRNAAQAVIYTEGEKLKLWQEAIAAGHKQIHKKLKKELQQEITAEIQKRYESGELKAFTAEEEARLIAAAAKERRHDLRRTDQEIMRARVYEQIEADVLSGKLKLFTPEEWKTFEQQAIDDATKRLKALGTVSLEQLKMNRDFAIENLIKMGHDRKNVYALYGMEANPSFDSFLALDFTGGPYVPTPVQPVPVQGSGALSMPNPIKRTRKRKRNPTVIKP